MTLHARFASGWLHLGVLVAFASARGSDRALDALASGVKRSETRALIVGAARAPLNARMVEMVHDAEKRGAGSPKLSAHELWAGLTAHDAPRYGANRQQPFKQTQRFV